MSLLPLASILPVSVNLRVPQSLEFGCRVCYAFSGDSLSRGTMNASVQWSPNTPNSQRETGNLDFAAVSALSALKKGRDEHLDN
jgi:hypothetical protein